MAKIVAKDTVKVFSFPESKERIKIAMDSIESLTKQLRSDSDYEIELSISSEDLHKQYPDFSDFLRRFYETCMKFDIFSTPSGNPFALEMLDLFCPIIRDPGKNKRYRLGDYTSRKKEEFVQLVEEARSNSEEWRPAIGVHVHMLDDPRFLGRAGAGGHGCAWIATDPKKFRTALVTRKYSEIIYSEIIYHEFLHLFGVGEGYDEKHKPKSGCEKCWMQYEVYFGTGLCQKHQDELREFLERMKGKEIECI